MVESKTQRAVDGEKTESSRRLRRTRIGVVASDSPDKSIKVVCQFTVKHPKYGKYIRRRTVIHVHDENNDAKSGDRVQVMECRPHSKMKRWRLIRVLDSA